MERSDTGHEEQTLFKMFATMWTADTTPVIKKPVALTINLPHVISQNLLAPHCTSAAYPSPGAPAPGPGQMHRQVFCWIQDHVNAFAAGKLADNHRKDVGLTRVETAGLHPSSLLRGSWSHKSARRSHRFKKSRTDSLNCWTAVGFSAVFWKVQERVPQVWDFVKALLACCC